MNFDNVVDTIHSACAGKVTGYGYAIFTGRNLRRSGGHGFAVWEENVKFDANTRMDLGSLGKTITAAAALHAIQHHQSIDLEKALDLPAKKFLPPWPIHPSLDESTGKARTTALTLLQLLQHKSGLTPFDDDIGRMPAIKMSLSVGRSNSNPKYNYLNLNFDCFRVMLPYLAKAADSAVLNTMPDPTYEDFSANFYASYIKENILAKCRNIPSSVTVGNSGPKPYTLYYWHPHEDEGGVDSYDQFLSAGSGGWRMSAEQYGEFIVGLRHQAFFKKGSRAWDLMKDKELGLSATETSTVPKLKVWMKNGAWGNGRQGYKTAWIAVEDKQPYPHWPEAFTAVLITNSRLGDVVEQTQKSSDLVPEKVLLAAYERGLLL
jgi:CubicO group peptidase (beta-lactamase class C family)